MRRKIYLVPLLVLGFLQPTAAASQSVVVDEGTFRLLADGRQIGTESFTIHRLGTGADAQILATAEIRMEVPEGRLDLRPALQAAGTDMAVSAYQVKVSGAHQEEVTVELGDRRFLTRVRTEHGLQEREYRAAPGTLLLDTRVAHQYYFVSHRVGDSGGSVPVMVPREGRQYDLQITPAGGEQVEIGGQNVQARRLRLEGGGDTRDLWVDDEGRVLRVEFADGGFVAIRERLP